MAVKILAALLVIACLGALGYYAYSFYSLEQAHQELQQELSRAENKALQLQQRYRRQKAVEANLTRTKLTLEGHIRVLEQEKEELALEKQELAQANAALKNRMDSKIKDTIARLESEKKTLEDKLQQAIADISSARDEHRACMAEMEQTKNTLEGEIASLDSQLEIEKGEHNRCREHNARLSVIGMDVLDAYFDKGPLESVFQAEPLIQAKQIELEKIVQEYKDMIDENTLFDERQSALD